MVTPGAVPEPASVENRISGGTAAIPSKNDGSLWNQAYNKIVKQNPDRIMTAYADILERVYRESELKSNFFHLHS